MPAFGGPAHHDGRHDEDLLAAWNHFAATCPMDADVIVIGAGPSGLMAARKLAEGGRQVLLLEARDRTGGRAHTTYDEQGESIERGAEFVHGRLPRTMALLKEAGLSYTASGGEWIQVRGGAASDERAAGDWPHFLRKLKGLKEDMSLQEFLEQHFPEERYAALKDRAIGYAEGYDAADASKVSAMALYEEWSGDEEEEYRIDEGYSGLCDYLRARCEKAGCRILLAHPVSGIRPDGTGVTVVSGTREFRAERVVVALPLGVLQSGGGVIDGATEQMAALRSLGFGQVIKIVLRFREPFWEERYPGLGFLFSGAAIPTWWTQAPEESTVLTGWLAGPAATRRAGLSDRQLLGEAMESLEHLFSIEQASLQAELTEVHIANWSKDPYTLGAYAYATVGSAAAISRLSQPLAGRIWLAGEYMYAGPAMGTVEAALVSGQDTAQAVLASC